MIQLRILRDTYFKRKTVDSLELDENDKVKTFAGETYDLASWAEVENHLFVEFQTRKFRDRSVWFVFSPDAEILIEGLPHELQSDTKAYEFMRRLNDLSRSISEVQNFLTEQMKYKLNKT
jgi:hypothetical protein